jgi:HD-GYP domain-containing protein (c-di-GMP phosphodiesterase class II)
MHPIRHVSLDATRSRDDRRLRRDSHSAAAVPRELRVAIRKTPSPLNTSSASVETILGLLTALEARDSYTHRHSLRVARYADRLACLLGLSARDRGLLYTAALLHDIGKIGIADGILLKPGRLDTREFDTMKTHSALGERILAPIFALSREAVLVKHHHEWWNGRGYPDGLKGRAIPLGARIIQIADSLDAMLTPRSYKTGCSPDRALRELWEGRGCQFDPDLAETAIFWMTHHPEHLAFPH